MKPCLLQHEAEHELNAAAAYYERQRRGLGLELLDEVAHAIELIERFPLAWPLHRRSGLRAVALPRFPFVLHYLEAPDALWIIAVAHTKREPGYWRGRLG